MSNGDQTTTYDTCQPPICPDDIVVRITSYDNEVCVNDETYVSWVVDGTKSNPLENTLLWSFNNLSFSNSSVSLSNDKPYYSLINVPVTTGIIYFKVKVNINGSFYESEVYTISVIDDPDICEAISYIVPAYGCVCLGFETPATIWVKEDGFPQIPDPPYGIKTVYFKDSGKCYYIDESSIQNKVLYDNQAWTILDSVNNEYPDCETCCFPLTGCDFE